MTAKTRALTLSALLSSLTVTALYVSSLWPTMQLSIAAFASIFTAAAVIEAGAAAGISVYVVSSALGAIILPDKTAILVYVLLFGYYPVVKSGAERLRSAAARWTVKLAVFFAAFTVMWFLLRELVFGFGTDAPNAAIAYLAGGAVFVLFDYGFSKVIWLYECRISKNIKRK